MNWILNPSSVEIWRDTKSRVMGDYQARFCGRFRGEIPLYLPDAFAQMSTENFSRPPSPSLIILIKVVSLMSLALFSILEI